ncbi:MAG: DsbA family protein [Arachnia sp.]
MANSSGLSRRAALRQQQELEARRKRNSRIIVASLLALAAIVIAIVVIVIADNAGQDQQQAAGAQQTPPNATTSNGIEVVSTGTEAAPDAPHVVVYEDYQCSGCAAYEATYGPALMELVDNGEITIEFITASFMQDRLQNDSSARPAAAAAAADAVGYYRQYHAVVFANQPTTAQGYTDDQLLEDFPAEAGITGEDLGRFQELYRDGVFTDFVAAQDQQFIDSSFTSTPTYAVGGVALEFFDENEALQIQPTVDDMRRAILEAADQ